MQEGEVKVNEYQQIGVLYPALWDFFTRPAYRIFAKYVKYFAITRFLVFDWFLNLRDTIVEQSSRLLVGGTYQRTHPTGYFCGGEYFVVYSGDCMVCNTDNIVLFAFSFFSVRRFVSICYLPL